MSVQDANTPVMDSAGDKPSDSASQHVRAENEPCNKPESKKRSLEDAEPAGAEHSAKHTRMQNGTDASGGVPSGSGQQDGPAAGATDPAGSGPSSNASAQLTTLTAAYSTDKGCRNYMEDVCFMQPDARPPRHQSSCRLAFFGVIDGHGGVSCASFVAHYLNKKVLDCGLLRKGLNTATGTVDAKACKACVVEGFKATDEALLKECSANNWQDGACAVAVWVLQDLVLVANVGDAKCVLGRLPDQATTSSGPALAKPQPKAIVLTKEHTALLERQRIEKAGGTVVNGRLAGRIQIARSFGDAAFKKLGCSSTPDVTAFPLTSRDAFLLLGSDGFWGVFGAQEAVDMAQGLLSEGLGAKAVTNRILNVAVREKRCKDNCSVLLIRFAGTTPQEAQSS